MNNDMNIIYIKRRANLATWMAQQSIGAVIFQDSEESRNPAIRYFTGHPSDAVLAISIDGKSVLIPWDENMAKLMACSEKIIPFTRFERNPIQATLGALKQLKIPLNSRVEIPSTTPYPEFLHYVDTLTGYDVLCRENGVAEQVASLRAIKDEYEISCIRKACEITDTLINEIEKKVKDGSIKTEMDAALLIEKECRKEGCERTGFETLAAGPERSFGIHCFPAYTANPFPAQGLSILDFGVVYKGYTSDVTITIAKEPLTEEQEKQLSLVEKSYKESIALYENDVQTKTAAAKAEEVFAKEKRTMPHALGHGIGLEAHEYPTVRIRATSDVVFKPGMVVTIEPGLYDTEIGGCRLENDILITETGHEVLTHARIIRV